MTDDTLDSNSDLEGPIREVSRVLTRTTTTSSTTVIDLEWTRLGASMHSTIMITRS
jgi:hypothetical protein